MEKGSSVPLSCFVTQPFPLERKKNEKTGHDVVFLTTFFLFIPGKKKLVFVFEPVLEACMPLIHVLHLIGPASHRHNNPSNQLPQHPGEIESAHSPH